jgi:hypothetical protein
MSCVEPHFRENPILVEAIFFLDSATLPTKRVPKAVQEFYPSDMPMVTPQQIDYLEYFGE